MQSYLSDLTQLELEKTETRRALEIMLYASNLEHAGDIIHLNLVERIKAKAKQSITFTLEQHASLDDLCLIIHQSLQAGDGRADFRRRRRRQAPHRARRILSARWRTG